MINYKLEAVVEYEYEAEQEDELTLKVGEIITNVQTAEGGWWEGELNGKKGMFPENFVKLVKRREAPPLKKEEKREATQRKSVRELASKFKDGVPMGGAAIPKKKDNKKYCKVLFEYKKENDDELELNIGEIVEFHKQVEEGWWEGTLNGRHGVFPSNFVEMIEDEPPVSVAPPVPQPNEDKPQTTNTSMAAAGGEKDDFHTIKGKKVMGVGLGNIFGEGPIKLRATGGGPGKKDDPSVKEPTAKPTKPPEPEPIPEAAKREKQIPERAVVRFSYAAEQPDELSLAEGQIIMVLDKALEDDGWWKGEVNGKEGVFPDNFVELLPSEEPTRPKKPPPPSSAAKHNQHPKLPEKAMGDSDEKIKTDTAPPLPSSIKKPAAPPPIGKKPSSQKFGEGVLPVSKPEPPPPSKPVAGSGRRKDDQSHTDHHMNNDDAGGFDNLIESSGQKLTHLTANRNKGPKKRPPSTVLTLNEGEKDAESMDDGKVNNITTTTTDHKPLPSKESKHSGHIEPSPTQQLQQQPRVPSPNNNRTQVPSAPSTTMSTSTHLPQRPPEPTTAPPSISSAAPNMQQTNKLLERLQRELDDLKANSVNRSEFSALQKEHNSLKSDFENLRVQHSKKLRELMNEVDDEKKLRLSTQVEIERVKKLLAESHV